MSNVVTFIYNEKLKMKRKLSGKKVKTEQLQYEIENPKMSYMFENVIRKRDFTLGKSELINVEY